jgi:hypothetical protein
MQLLWLIGGLIWGLFYIPILLIKFVVLQLVLWISRTPGLHVRGDRGRTRITVKSDHKAICYIGS